MWVFLDLSGYADLIACRHGRGSGRLLHNILLLPHPSNDRSSPSSPQGKTTSCSQRSQWRQRKGVVWDWPRSREELVFHWCHKPHRYDDQSLIWILIGRQQQQKRHFSSRSSWLGKNGYLCQVDRVGGVRIYVENCYSCYSKLGRFYVLDNWYFRGR